jgi:hypothetical protein
MRIDWVAVTSDKLDHERIWAIIGAVLLVAGFLFPVERLPLRCWFKTVTGVPCATCGATRMVLRFRRLDVVGALATNPFLAVATLLAGAFFVYAWIVLLFRTRRLRIRLTRRWERILIRVVIVAAFFGNWAYLIWAGR